MDESHRPSSGGTCRDLKGIARANAPLWCVGATWHAAGGVCVFQALGKATPMHSSRTAFEDVGTFDLMYYRNRPRWDSQG